MYAIGQARSDQPLHDPEEVWFTDRRTFVWEDYQKAGYAVVGSQQVTEAQLPHPPATLAQNAKLLALTGALGAVKDR